MYLGAPMLHQRLARHQFTFVLDKMRKKLSGWKASFLSFAGRVALAQSSLASIPGYVLQATPVPLSICDEAEKIYMSSQPRVIEGLGSIDQKNIYILIKKKEGLGSRICGSSIKPT